MPDNKLVIIDDRMVMNILSDNRVLNQISNIKIASDRAKSLVRIGAKGAGCRPCQSKARNTAIDLMIVKKAIAQMPKEQKDILKGLMRTEQARIVYKNDSNKIIQLTF